MSRTAVRAVGLRPLRPPFRYRPSRSPHPPPPPTPPVAAAEDPIPADPPCCSTTSEPRHPQEIAEGPGRIPQLGRRETHRLPSADEILASLEAEMAKQEREEPAPRPSPDESPSRLEPEPVSTAPDTEERLRRQRVRTRERAVVCADVERCGRPGRASPVACRRPRPRSSLRPNSNRRRLEVVPLGCAWGQPQAGRTRGRPTGRSGPSDRGACT